MTRLTSFFFMLSMLSFPARADAQAASAVVRGTVVDVSSAPIVGATVAIEGTTLGAITDSEGKFLILGAEPGTAVVTVSFIGYKRFRSEPLELRRDESCELSVTLEPESSQLDGAVVVATRKVDSDAGLIAQMRSARYVASGISAQTIARTQDKDASEVIRRVPGISVIDDKFVIVRGLAQRYNNVWINGAAVPSSEADTRAFSFDVLPSSQIDNLLIVKSPAPELPADFSGGFIRIRTKVVPEENSLTISYGTGFNSVTHSNDFRYAPGSATDWLGFDNGMRSLKNVPHRVDNDDVTTVDRVTRTGFNNDWRVLSRRPTIDQKLNIALNRRFVTARRDAVGLVAALNYSNTNKSLLRMENSQFGIYNYTEDEPLYNFKYTDNQYTNDVKLGAMLNLSYVPAADKRSCVSRYEFRNIFNQLGRNRFTDREGWRNVSGYYEQQQDEYLYVSRSAYTGQFAGSHDWIRSGAKFDWNAAYSYYEPPPARPPDRRAREKSRKRHLRILDRSGQRIALLYLARRARRFGRSEPEPAALSRRDAPPRVTHRTIRRIQNAPLRYPQLPLQVECLSEQAARRFRLAARRADLRTGKSGRTRQAARSGRNAQHGRLLGPQRRAGRLRGAEHVARALQRLRRRPFRKLPLFARKLSVGNQFPDPDEHLPIQQRAAVAQRHV